MDYKQIFETNTIVGRMFSEAKLQRSAMKVFDDLLWDRKADSFNGISRVDEDDLEDKLSQQGASLQDLKVLSDKKVFGTKLSKNDNPIDKEFKGKMDQYFILHTSFGRYLIDTQGYDYARYIVRLV